MLFLLSEVDGSSKTNYTDEQLRIIRKAVSGKSLVINAYAGTGKTTTLIGISENFKFKKLYIAYNRKIAEEAKNKFKSGTHVYTTHSLAYKHLKKVLRLDGVSLGNITTYSIMEKLSLNYERALVAHYLFKTLMQTPYSSIRDEGFISYISKDPYFVYEILLDYIIKRYGYGQFKEIASSQDRINTVVRNICISHETYVNDIDDLVATNQIPMPHDYYLKKFYEMFKSGDIKLNYDMIMIDEAQDSNELTLALIELIGKNKTKIIVGDKYQQIYGFRGADNIMEKVKDCEWEALTYSFRFGKEIADRLNNVIFKYLGEKINIRGMGGSKTNGKTAIIARTNSSLIPHGIEQESFSISRSIDDIFFVPMQVYYFAQGMYDKIDNRFSFWKNMNSIIELEELARSIKDKETLNAIRIYNRYGKGIVKIKNEFANKVKKDAQLELTTAHSAKGLEYENVVIEDDFDDLSSMKNEIRNELDQKIYREEVNLYYVAISRTIKNCLDRSINHK